jgi:hypothetical protein
VKVAGDASSLTITTMHDVGNTFDPLFVAPGADLINLGRFVQFWPKFHGRTLKIFDVNLLKTGSTM